jgi:hypothetical protein
MFPKRLPPHRRRSSPRLLSIVSIQEADLSRIAEGRASLKIGFAQCIQIACRSGEFSGAADDMSGIAGDGEARLRKRIGNGSGGGELDAFLKST